MTCKGLSRHRCKLCKDDVLLVAPARLSYCPRLGVHRYDASMMSAFQHFDFARRHIGTLNVLVPDDSTKRMFHRQTPAWFILRLEIW